MPAPTASLTLLGRTRGGFTNPVVPAAAIEAIGLVDESGNMVGTASNPMPVTGSVTASGGLTDAQLRATAVPVSAAALPLPSGAATEASVAATAASASVLDDWDEGDRAKVNCIAGQVGVQGGSGTVTALTQRVVLATDVALPTLPTGSVSAHEASATVTGLDTFRDPALTNTAVAVKASAGRLYAVHIENPNATKAYVQLYDVAAAGVTVGTTTPKKTLFVPGSGGYDFAWPVPVTFGTAIAAAATTTAAGGTAPGSALLLNVDYK